MLTTEKKAEIVRSPILAKAVLKRANGQFEAIVVFAGSTRYEFFWTFRLRSPRSPRRTWKLVGNWIRQTANVGTRPDFRVYAINQALLHQAEIISLRMPHVKRLKALMTMNDMDFDKMIAGPQKEVSEWEVRKLNQKFRSHLHGGAVFPGWRAR
jgi:hypothetical protein